MGISERPQETVQEEADLREIEKAISQWPEGPRKTGLLLVGAVTSLEGTPDVVRNDSGEIIPTFKIPGEEGQSPLLFVIGRGEVTVGTSTWSTSELVEIASSSIEHRKIVAKFDQIVGIIVDAAFGVRRVTHRPVKSPMLRRKDKVGK